MSEYHGLGPDDIVGMRAKEKSFVKIHDEIGRGKAKGQPGKGPQGQPQGKGEKK
jgi:hypothetical protein